MQFAGHDTSARKPVLVEELALDPGAARSLVPVRQKALSARPGAEYTSAQAMSSQGMFWDLMDAARAHPWLRMSIATIGRSIIGMGWSIKEVPGKSPKKRVRKDIESFFLSPPDRGFASIKDFYTVSSKLYLTGVCLRLFGVAAWEPVRNGMGKAIGFDYVWGYVVPNVNEQGKFLSPAWKVYPSRRHLQKPIEYADPNDLVVFMNPDFGGLAYSSDLEASTRFSLPSDIWAMVSYLKLHSERMAPYDGMWVMSPEVTDAEFERTKALLIARYLSAENFGRNPIIARGDIEWKATRRGEDEMPYKEGRAVNRQEIVGLAGTTGAQVGVTEDMNRANLQQVRKQTHETTTLPVTILMEEVIYNQVMVREFGEDGYRLHFNPPDFLTVIERSGVAMRMRQLGALDRNEMRDYVLNMPATEGGDGDFLYPSNTMVADERGGPPENPDLQDPSDGSETVPGSDPPRTDDPDQYRNLVMARELAGRELRQWRTVYTRTIKGERRPKPFVARFIPPEAQNLIANFIDSGAPPDQVLSLFDEAMEVIRV